MSRDNHSYGWVKLYRSLMDKGWYSKSDYVHLWIHIMLKANHSGKEIWFGSGNIKLKPGQFVTGRKKLSSETGINESKVERILKCFESEQQIEQQKSNKSRLVSVLNYDEYQNNEQQNEQQLNNKRTTSEQQLNTNKNEENKKKEKKYKGIVVSFFTDLVPYFFDDDFVECWKDFETVRAKKKCVASERAYTKLLNKLNELTKDKDVAKKIVSTSADCGWSDLYPPKQNDNNDVEPKRFTKDEFQPQRDFYIEQQEAQQGGKKK